MFRSANRFIIFIISKFKKKNINKGRQESKEFLINIQMAFAWKVIH